MIKKQPLINEDRMLEESTELLNFIQSRKLTANEDIQLVQEVLAVMIEARIQAIVNSSGSKK